MPPSAFDAREAPNGHIGEINRRAALRQARRCEITSIVTASVAVIAVIISAVSLLLGG